MSKEIYISSTPHETRLAIVENDELAEIYYERENEYTLAGSIYNGKVTRVLPGMQSAFVDVGLERDAFLYITDFMEEAGDTADFDSADPASRGRGREPRSAEGGRSPEARDSRGDDRRREGNRLSAPSEAAPLDSAQLTEGGSPRSEARSDRSDRGGDRRDRSRTRTDGRDDRSSRRDGDFTSRDRRPTAYRTDEPSQTPSTPPPPFPGLELTGDSDGVPTDVGSMGEGADGSRRWRGRRGRRRGRGPGQPELTAEQMQEPAGSMVNEPGAFDPAFNLSSVSDAFDLAESEAAGNFDLDASASVTDTPPKEDAAGAATAAQEQGIRSRDRRDRGDRGDRGGRGDRGASEGSRGGRQDRSRRSPRAPRGFAPSRALYGVENTSPLDERNEDDQLTPEPVVLPGESLSKYRSASIPDSASNTAISAPPTTPSPKPEFTLPGTWDGGAVLPGESLSRRSRGETASHPAPRSESRFEARPSNPTTPAETSSASAVIADADGISVLPIPSSLPEVIQASNSTEGESPVTTVEANASYEPVEASASLRYVPTPPSEFRQSAPAEAQSGLPAKPFSEPGEPLQQSSDVVPQPSVVHSITPQPETPLAPLTVQPSAVLDLSPEPPTELIPDHDSGQPEHAFTSIASDGEMSSAISCPSVAEGPPSPSNPMDHETAVLDASSDDASQGPLFAPGDGALEEELIDEEEFDLPGVHANAGDDLSVDEDTLEGTADLGTMIRDLSIDQITRHPETGELDDDEILEEEDAAHDALYVEAEETEGTGFGSPDPHLSDDDAVPSDLTDTSEASFGAVAQDVEPSSVDRDRSRRDNGRRRDRNDRGDRNDRRDRSRTPGDRGPRPGRRDGRHSMQTTNLPAISDLLKPGQEVLVQIAKEPIAKKGARITSHIALPGRFLVFMPTVNHTGVSRKIESDGERRRLKEILLSEKGDASGGFIVRTAAAGATEEELRSDLRFLLNLWADIKQRSESSKSPALIYHDLNLVERILRDQVTDSFSAIWVDTEDAYERVLRFLQRFQPSLIRRVKLYTKDTPLFEQFGITEEINKALRSKVWLKSGGSIVINQTEALVAIDINTGKYVGKTARLEDTIVKTNLDAIPEIVRQIRLRDLGGIIIIDFIDMDERKNRNRVMTALEEELQKDRAPSKVLQFNDFGLVAITRKRVKQSLERTLSTTCTICQGTGMTKSPVTISNDIYVEMRKMQKHLDRGDVMLRVNPEVVKQLKAPGTRWLQEMEELVGKTILVKSDPALHPEQFDIH